MALEAAQATRYSEMLSTLEKADEQFTTDLRLSARSLLLYRIAGSLDKRAEMAFVFDVIKKIKEEYGSSGAIDQVLAEMDTILGEGVEGKSVGTLFSSVACVVEELNAKYLYRLMSDLRKAPISGKISD